MIYRRLSGFALFLCFFLAGFSQSTPQANYALAARFSPTKGNKMLFSTSVDPHWLKLSDRFWYTYENREGKNWYIVDALKGSKRPMFDPVKLAAEITRIVKDPFDGQHLPITNLKFTTDENSVRFEILSTLDEEKKDTSKTQGAAGAGRRGGAGGRAGAPGAGTAAKSKKTFFFEYNLNTGILTELKDYEKPKENAMWASFSPDRKFIFFSRKNNLYYMDSANYSKALVKDDDSTIVETPLTKDGEENYSYGGGGNETNVDKEKNKDKRKGIYLLWSRDGRYFTISRTDNRQVKDLWVINNTAEPRPTLETYKYQMPGETEAPQEHLILCDLSSKKVKELKAGRFKDQTCGIWAAPQLAKDLDVDFPPSVWLGTNARFYLSRSTRNLKS